MTASNKTMILKIGDSVSIYEPIRKNGFEYAWRPYNVTRMMGEYCTLTSSDLKKVRSPVSVAKVEELIGLQTLEKRTTQL